MIKLAVRLASSLLLVAMANVLGMAQTASDKAPQSAPSQSSAQPNQDQDPTSTGPAMVLKVKTRLVVVDVVALDHKGAPVTDLKSDDFTVVEDGKDQRTRVFTFQHPGEPAVGRPV